MTQNQVGKQQNLQEFPQRDEKKDRVYRGLSQIVLVPRAGIEAVRMAVESVIEYFGCRQQAFPFAETIQKT